MITLKGFPKNIAPNTKFGDVYNFVIINKNTGVAEEVYKFLFDMQDYRVYLCINSVGHYEVIKEKYNDTFSSAYDYGEYDCINCLIEDSEIDVTVTYLG